MNITLLGSAPPGHDPWGTEPEPTSQRTDNQQQEGNHGHHE
jgi:hypothetical protein